MRVTENTNYDVVRDSIRRSKERMETLQGQSATLKKLNAPSDDPVGSVKVLELRTDKVNNDQYQVNSKIAEAFLNNSDQAVSELSEIVLRAKEIALGQASGASSNEDTRIGVSEEVTQLFNQAVSVSNRNVANRFLFGGYKTTQPPVDMNGQYRGDRGQMMLETSKDVFVTINIPGMDVFNTEPEQVFRAQQSEQERKENGETISERAPASKADEEANVNLFDQLQSLRIALLSGDIEGVRQSLEKFDSLHRKLVAVRAQIGSRAQGIQSANQAIERNNITNAMLSSSLEDADMVQVVSDLAKEETVFRSALATSRKLIQPTLLDFLR